MEEKPNLKVGVRIWRTRFGRQLRIGSRFSNITLPDQFQQAPTEGLLRLLDGRRTTSQLANSTGLSETALSDFISQLCGAGLVDLKQGKRRSERTSTTIVDSIGSQALRDIQSQIEADGITLAPFISDGGAESVARRSEFEILIFGTGRIAITLLGALRAAGFVNSNLIDRSPQNHHSRAIRPRDLMGGIFRNSEILHNKAAVIAGLAPARPCATPQLIISVGAPSFDTQQRWLSESTAHLLISHETSGELRLGPIVIPGKTPCLTCIEMSEVDAGLEPSLRPAVIDIEVSVGLALLGAGIALLEVSAFAATGRSQLTAKSLEITSHRYIAPALRNWNFHPLCGCRS